MNTTKLDTTTRITAHATIGDLINTIQTVLNHNTLDTVVIDAGGRLHTAPDYWTATYGRPAEEVIDVGAHQEATQILQKHGISVNQPMTAEQLAAEAIERGWVDNAIDELATKQAYSLRIPHPHEGYSRDTATEYVTVTYDPQFGTEITVTSDLKIPENLGQDVLTILAKPGEHVTRDELVERLYTTRKNIKQQIKDHIRGNN